MWMSAWLSQTTKHRKIYKNEFTKKVGGYSIELRAQQLNEKHRNEIHKNAWTPLFGFQLFILATKMLFWVSWMSWLSSTPQVYKTNKAILSIFYGRRIPTVVFLPCQRKKKLKKKPSRVFLVRDLWKSLLFFSRKTTDLGKKCTLFSACRRKKLNKTQMSVFLRAGTISSHRRTCCP